MHIFLVMVVAGVIATVGVGAIGGAGAGFVGLLIWIGALLILGLVLSSMAKRQVSVRLGAPAELVLEAVLDEFKTLGWTRVNGPGAFNFKARGFGMSMNLGKPVVSVDVEQQEDGSTGVDIWLSTWNSQWGVVGCCDRVVTKVWQVQRRMAQLEADTRTDA
ncbi:hypothetical protein [Nocardia macrotermitis]|uniref:Uncharacterized protein n=1 Tax=Nocardia macrotermitis TaxID=2585198 RepID=A0A7K0D337_9NOCA|nr:hypothetical protein [Nocardia macrotermitis]MQY20129.1 hypothetical protein [Nocardia macrotermitis]